MALFFWMSLFFGGFVITSGCFVAGSHDSVAATIQVQEGETAVLLFNFSGINLENQTFDCRRDDENFTDSNKYVFSIRMEVENFEPQSESYKNRVFLNQISLRAGIVILKISSVIQSDSGVYLLTVPKLEKNQNQTLTQILTLVVPKHKWFAEILVAVIIIIIIIIIIVLLKIKPWNPKDEEKSPSCEMKIRAKDSIDEEKELLRV